MTKVLLVDDNDRQRKLSRIHLERAGYLVEETASATEAIRAARMARPDVIVSDVMMDAIDGFGLCRRLRDDVLLAPIPVVLVSAHYDDPSARELATTLGASALIQRTPDFSAEMEGISACITSTTSKPRRMRRESYEVHLEANARQLHKLLEETRRAEQHWRALFDHANDAIALITPDGVIVEANRRWEAAIGVPPCEMVGHHIRDYAAPGCEEANATTFHDALANRVSHALVALQHANGSIVYMDFSASTVALEGTNHLLTMGRDVTLRVLAERRAAAAEAERRKLEEQIAHVQRLETIGQMTGSIAHDFNNILGAILLNSESIVEELAEGDPRREAAEDIRAATRRAAALTKHLLAFSRNQVLELADLDISTVIASTGRMVRRLIGPEIPLFVEDHADHAIVRADLVQLEQVIVNLAVNARDAMPSGGTLRIETTTVQLPPGELLAAGDYVLLAVTDTGCGMSEETKQRVFEPFFTTKPRGQGTGLGLSTCFGIVKQLGGEILIDSEVGRGTTMKVYLPRV
ncbi:MAG: ATP-binding protein [Kofleriaceae bacterium]